MKAPNDRFIKRELDSYYKEIEPDRDQAHNDQGEYDPDEWGRADMDFEDDGDSEDAQKWPLSDLNAFGHMLSGAVSRLRGLMNKLIVKHQ
jgi:hypothetical protein